MWFFLSLYLQQVLGYSPLRAGLAFLPMTLSIVVGSTLASRGVDPGRSEAAAGGRHDVLGAGTAAVHAACAPDGTTSATSSARRCWWRSGSDVVRSGDDRGRRGCRSRRSRPCLGVVNTSRLLGGALGSRSSPQSRPITPIATFGTRSRCTPRSPTGLSWRSDRGRLAAAGTVIAAVGLPEWRSGHRAVRRSPPKAHSRSIPGECSAAWPAACDSPASVSRARSARASTSWTERLPPPYEELVARAAGARGLLTLLTDRIEPR